MTATNGQMVLLDMPSELTRAGARRAAMAAAKARGEAMRDAAGAAVEAVAPGWVTAAVEALRRFARSQVGVFSIEQARSVLAIELPKVSELRAWGKVTSEASSLGYIVPVPRTFIPAASSNGTPKQAWKRGPAA